MVGRTISNNFVRKLMVWLRARRRSNCRAVPRWAPEHDLVRTILAWRTRGYGLMISRLQNRNWVAIRALPERCGGIISGPRNFLEPPKVSISLETNVWCQPSGSTLMKPIPMRLNVLLWLSLAAVACLEAIPTKAPAKTAATDSAPEGPTRLLRFADISKDRVVFAYAGDLWISSREGGAARRLTSHVGDEVFPKFSPDGKWIAFTGEYDGNPDVYVMSAEGGEPKRLTFHPSNDIVLGWTPD